MKVKAYAKPVYPARALDRGIAGWVDLEFTVEPDGSTSHVEVLVQARRAQDQYFRREAVAAVEQWKFEPRVFHEPPDRAALLHAYSLRGAVTPSAFRAALRGPLGTPRRRPSTRPFGADGPIGHNTRQFRFTTRCDKINAESSLK